MNKFFTKKYWNEEPTSFEFGIFIGGIVGCGLTVLAMGLLVVILK